MEVFDKIVLSIYKWEFAMLMFILTFIFALFIGYIRAERNRKNIGDDRTNEIQEYFVNNIKRFSVYISICAIMIWLSNIIVNIILNF